MNRELTDAQRLWVELRDAGPAGLHSHDIRSRGFSGNPSSRMKDIVSKGVPIFTARENRGKRPGSRFWLEPHAPDFAVAVRPNGVEGGVGGDPCKPPAGASLGTEPINLVCDATDRENITFRKKPLREAA